MLFCKKRVIFQFCLVFWSFLWFFMVFPKWLRFDFDLSCFVFSKCCFSSRQSSTISFSPEDEANWSFHFTRGWSTQKKTRYFHVRYVRQVGDMFFFSVGKMRGTFPFSLWNFPHIIIVRPLMMTSRLFFYITRLESADCFDLDLWKVGEKIDRVSTRTWNIQGFFFSHNLSLILVRKNTLTHTWKYQNKPFWAWTTWPSIHLFAVYLVVKSDLICGWKVLFFC